MTGPLVAYVGNFRHAHCTEVHVAAALEEIGCRVNRLQEGPPGQGASFPTIAAVGKAADMLLYTRTWGWPGNETDAIAVWRDVEAAGTATVSFHLDLYLGLEREATLEGDPFWSTQWCFTPDGDPASETKFAERGIQHVWSPPAVHGPECVPGTVTPRFQHGVVFVGSFPYPHPEWPYRNQLVEWCDRTYGPRFARYGGNGTVVRNKPLNDLYASAGVVVGDSLCPGFTKPRYWSDRLTETVGRGGFLIWPRIEGVADLGFADGVHFREYEFGDFDKLRDLIDFYLEHPEQARQIAADGQRFVRENHTYAHRLRSVLETVGIEI